jgi:hypothetical protein
MGIANQERKNPLIKTSVDSGEWLAMDDDALQWIKEKSQGWLISPFICDLKPFFFVDPNSAFSMKRRCIYSRCPKAH